MRYLETPSAAKAYQNYPVPGVTRDRVRRSLMRFRELLRTSRTPADLQAAVKREFVFYQSVGSDSKGSVLFTAYYEPVYAASRVPTAEYRYPVYRLPQDFQSWSRPHPTRLELEGADGLQALTWKRPLDSGIVLVRPLLEISRSETGQFCQNMHIKVWSDSTNQDLKYARNRIRQELIPILQCFNPQVESTLAQTAELLQAEVEYLEQAAHQLSQQAIWDQQVAHQLPIRLNRRVLQTAPLALQRRVMRQILQQILPNNPSFEHIEKLTALITAPNRSQTDPFPGGAIAYVNKDWIELKHL